jgi:hypothetical protein
VCAALDAAAVGGVGTNPEYAVNSTDKFLTSLSRIQIEIKDEGKVSVLRTCEKIAALPPDVRKGLAFPYITLNTKAFRLGRWPESRRLSAHQAAQPQQPVAAVFSHLLKFSAWRGTLGGAWRAAGCEAAKGEKRGKRTGATLIPIGGEGPEQTRNVPQNQQIAASPIDQGFGSDTEDEHLAGSC